jgi:excisionase family DNA binding protein
MRALHSHFGGLTDVEGFAMIGDDDVEPLLWTGEVASLLGVDPSTVMRWEKLGKLPCVRTAAGHRRFKEADVRRLQQQRKEDAW